MTEYWEPEQKGLEEVYHEYWGNPTLNMGDSMIAAS